MFTVGFPSCDYLHVTNIVSFTITYFPLKFHLVYILQVVKLVKRKYGNFFLLGSCKVNINQPVGNPETEYDKVPESA